MEGIISAHEAKTKFGELLIRVERGEEIVITRRELPVARIVPEGRPALSKITRIIDRIKIRRKTRRLNVKGRPRLTVKELVQEGRK